MKSSNRSAVLVAAALALAAASCNSSQPSSTGPQTATLTFSATATVDLADCYQIWLDTSDPPDGTADENSGQVWCYSLADVDSRPAPWNYSLLVTVIRAGQTEQELLGTSLLPFDNIPDFVSLTGYDGQVGTAPARAPDGGLYFVPVGRVSRASQIWLTSNLKESGGSLYDIQYNLGPSNVLEQPSFTFDLNVGDTVIVQARKQSVADGPAYFYDPPSSGANADLTLKGTLTIGSTQVPLLGTSTSSFDDMAGFTFSYTRQ